MFAPINTIDLNDLRKKFDATKAALKARKDALDREIADFETAWQSFQNVLAFAARNLTPIPGADSPGIDPADGKLTRTSIKEAVAIAIQQLEASKKEIHRGSVIAFLGKMTPGKLSFDPLASSSNISAELKHLAKTGKLALVRKGVGRSPSVYKTP